MAPKCIKLDLLKWKYFKTVYNILPHWYTPNNIFIVLYLFRFLIGPKKIYVCSSNNSTQTKKWCIPEFCVVILVNAYHFPYQIQY